MVDIKLIWMRHNINCTLCALISIYSGIFIISAKAGRHMCHVCVLFVAYGDAREKTNANNMCFFVHSVNTGVINSSHKILPPLSALLLVYNAAVCNFFFAPAMPISVSSIFSIQLHCFRFGRLYLCFIFQLFCYVKYLYAISIQHMTLQ